MLLLLFLYLCAVEVHILRTSTMTEVMKDEGFSYIKIESLGLENGKTIKSKHESHLKSKNE